MKSLSKKMFANFFILSLSSLTLHADEAVSVPASGMPKHPPLQFSVEAKERSKDYLQAFETLRKEKTAGKVQFTLKDGSTIANIIDIQLMENGSLLLFRFNSAQGIRFRVIALEEILRLEHL